MFGVLANVLTVLMGSSIGIIFRKAIPEKIASAAMIAIGLCNLCIGVSGMMEGKNALVLIISMVLGTMIGTGLDIDGRLNKLNTENPKNSTKGSNLLQGFITASLVFCVGSMTILGGLDAGLKNDNTLYYTKALLDLISSSMLAASLGIGVIFAAVTVFVYQGALVLLASMLAPFLSPEIIAELNCVGSVMIFALGLNLAGVGNFKVADFLPAIPLTPVVYTVISLL